MDDTHFPHDYVVCPRCGGDLFRAVPGKTTKQEVIEFQGELERRQGITDVDPGWIHPGVFCYDCEWGILIEYAPEGLRDIVEDNRPAELVLDSSGEQTTAVAAAIKNGIGLTSKAALTLARSAPTPLLQKPAPRVWQLENLQSAIEDAGGSAHIERQEAKSSEQDVDDQSPTTVH